MYPEQLDEAISTIYDAGMGEAPWADALSALGALFDADVYAVVWDTVAQRPVFEASCHRKAREPIVNSHINCCAIDPRLNLAASNGEAMICSELFDDRHLRSSELYNDFMDKYDLRYTAVFRLLEQDDQTVLVGLQRPRQLGPFQPREREWMVAARPHLVRAFRMRRILQSSANRAERCRSMIDHMLWAALLVTADARVLEWNRTAERVLGAGDGIALCQGRIVARCQGETSRLLHLIGKAARSTAAVEPKGGTCRISRAEGGFYAALVAADARDTGEACGEPAALLVLTDPSRRPLPSEQTLRDLYDLTAAEARTARRLLAGDGPVGIADQFGVGLGTVRTHLHRVFDKTGTASQADLVRLLLGCTSPMG